MKSVLVKTIPGYEFYSDGAIWNERLKRFLKGSDYDGHNYVMVNGKIEKRHRILAIMFLPITEEYKHIPIELLDVHHENGNGLDNRICNLKWKPRDKHRIDHLSIPIEMVTIDSEHEGYFDSAADASEKTGILRTAINNNLKGRSKTVRTKDGKRHRFRYTNKEPNSGSNCL